jgi:hypothetical protein
MAEVYADSLLCCGCPRINVLRLRLQVERVDEEVKVRLSFEEKMDKAEIKRKTKVMDEVIRSALTEDDDVRALREEKRKLVLEEKKLKALRDGLKSDANLQRKQDMLAEKTRQRRLQAQISEAKRRQVRYSTSNGPVHDSRGSPLGVLGFGREGRGARRGY